MRYPDSLAKLIASFQIYPGIGPKTAERLAFFTIMKASKEDVISFSQNLSSVVEKIKYCETCGVITEKQYCDICEDILRDNQLMIVENSKDVNTFEKTHQYNGKYHVLNGLVSPLNGVSPDDLNLKTLKDRIIKDKISEIIIATSATIEGEMTALYIKNILGQDNANISRIGYGLPAGADIEYTDELTLIKALEGRKKM